MNVTVVKHVYQVFRLVKVRHKIPVITIEKHIRYEWSTVFAHQNPNYLGDKRTLFGLFRHVYHVYTVGNGVFLAVSGAGTTAMSKICIFRTYF